MAARRRVPTGSLLRAGWQLQIMTDRCLVLNPLCWSPRGQIRALGAMVFATVVLAVVLAVLLLQQSQSARVTDAAHHLDRG